MADVSIIIATYGNEGWRDLAQNAAESARLQTVSAEVLMVHGTALHTARNDGARRASGEWLIFLDADDSLHPSYVEQMCTGTADLRQPATLAVYDDGSTDPEPTVIPPKPIHLGNWMVIGTMVCTELFKEAGGFWDEPAFEDWSLWWRCLDLDATWEAIPSAVYQVGVREQSRNAMRDPAQIGSAFRIVQQRHAAWRWDMRARQTITTWESA